MPKIASAQMSPRMDQPHTPRSGPSVNGVYERVVPQPYPARSAFAVKELPKGARVEIEAVATV